MFKNIGRKIKGLAKFLFWVLSIIAILGGVLVIIYGVGNVSTETEEKILFILIGIGIAIGGIIMAWLENFLLYGFGELVDSNQQILKLLEEKKEKTNTVEKI